MRTRGGLRLNPVRYKLGGIASLFRLPLLLPPRPRLPPRQPCTTERPTFPSFLPIVRQFFSNKNPQLPSGRFSRKRVETDKETERERTDSIREYQRCWMRRGWKKEERRKHGGIQEYRMVGGHTNIYERRRGESEWNRGKEISSVNGENPYPGSNDRGNGRNRGP